jgi:hypothetical protein
MDLDTILDIVNSDDMRIRSMKLGMEGIIRYEAKEVVES